MNAKFNHDVREQKGMSHTLVPSPSLRVPFAPTHNNELFVVFLLVFHTLHAFAINITNP
jgi:hypothetical protein